MNENSETTPPPDKPQADSFFATLRAKTMERIASILLAIGAIVAMALAYSFSDWLVNKAKDVLGVSSIEQELAMIGRHLGDIATAVSTTVDTVYVIEHEFTFPRPSRPLRQEVKQFLKVCEFHQLQSSESSALTDYVLELERATSLLEVFSFRADVGTQSEFQYDMECYSENGQPYGFDKPLDFDIRVNQHSLLEPHVRNWSRRARKTIDVLQAEDQSIGEATM